MTITCVSKFHPLFPSIPLCPIPLGGFQDFPPFPFLILYFSFTYYVGLGTLILCV